MSWFDAFNHLGVFAKLSLLAGLAPLGFAVAYAVRPHDRTLTLLRPVSLASIFAGICGVMAGFLAVLMGIAVTLTQAKPVASVPSLYVGLAEALVPMFVNAGVLAVSWLLVAVGMMRPPRVG